LSQTQYNVPVTRHVLSLSSHVTNRASQNISPLICYRIFHLKTNNYSNFE
jgi:hypothetical protein